MADLVMERKAAAMASPALPLGLLRVKIIRGFDLAKRDLFASDPYVVVSMAGQKVKTKVIIKTLNPEWNEELTLYVKDPIGIIKLEVFDKDTFTYDDPMGNVEIDIKPLLEAGTSQVKAMCNGDIIKIVTPNLKNCLVGESKIYLHNQKVVQDMILKLRNVECGKVELQLEWIDATSPR